MDFLKTIGGKVIGGLVALFVVVCAVSWYRTDPATKHMLLTGTGKISSWIGIVLVVPWISFSLVGWVARMDSNRSAAIFVTVMTALELALLLWLFGFNVPGLTAWCFLILGGLVAALYNVLTCDWIAEKIE